MAADAAFTLYPPRRPPAGGGARFLRVDGWTPKPAARRPAASSACLSLITSCLAAAGLHAPLGRTPDVLL